MGGIRKVKTPIQAIVKKCMECCCSVKDEVRQCDMYDCALWGFRLGDEVPMKSLKRKNLRLKNNSNNISFLIFVNLHAFCVHFLLILGKIFKI